MLLELFRNRPELACELLAVCVGIDARQDHVELGSIDLSQVVSVEYRADAVILLKNREGVTISAIIVEIQLQPDNGKHFSWPAYVTALRSRLERPVALLVVTDDPAVARWARREIDTGHPGFVLSPIVIDLHDVPRVTEQRACETPELAVLSAIAHPEIGAAKAALVGISLLPEERKRLYLDIVLKGLPSEIQRVIEDNMLKNYEYQSDFARKYYGQGKAEGKAEGKTEGKAEGGTEELRKAALGIARFRVPALESELVALIEAATEPARLQALITQMVAASDAEAVCAAIKALDAT